MSSHDTPQSRNYHTLRQEVVVRVFILHLLLAIASAFCVLVGITLIWLNAFKVDPSLITLFIATVPLPFAFLTFNYQANQMTLEAVARYSQALETTKNSGWDHYYGQYKVWVRLTSFLKVVPLLVPIVATLIYLLPHSFSSNQPIIAALWWADLLLALLITYNFRYKWMKL